MTIDEVMDKARLLRGLASDAKLALYLGTSQSSVAGWRNRRQWPSDELMLKLATAADIDPQFALIHLNIWRTEQSEVSNIYLDMLRKIGAGFVIVLALTNYSPAVAGDGAPAVYYEKLYHDVTLHIPNHQRYVSTERVASIAHPSRAKERWIVVLKAYGLGGYLDASGTSPKDPAIVVAGIAARADYWTEFEKAWVPMVRAELGLSRWHNTDFHNHWREYEGWKEAQDLVALRRVREVLGPLKGFVIGTGVFKADWEELRSEFNLVGPPIQFCIDYCISTLIHRFHIEPHDEGIAIYIDKDENENLARQITEWHEAYYRKDRERDISLTFGSNKIYAPLQAADIFSNETYRYMTGGDFSKVGMPFVGATFLEGPRLNFGPMLEGVLANKLPMIECFSKDRLRLQLKTEAEGPRRDGTDPKFVKGFVSLYRVGGHDASDGQLS